MLRGNTCVHVAVLDKKIRLGLVRANLTQRYDHPMRTLTIPALLLTACTSSPNYHVNYAPQSGTMTASKGDGVQRAVIAITDAGKEVESSDGGSGIVLSKWFQSDGFGADDVRYRIRVVLGDASYQVAAMCQRKSAMTSSWSEDCTSDDTRPRYVVDLVNQIAVSLGR